MMTEIDIDKLQFPAEMAPTIGLSKNQIAYLKKLGCPFFGRKSGGRWVREFIPKRGGEPEPQLLAHPQC